MNWDPHYVFSACFLGAVVAVGLAARLFRWRLWSWLMAEAAVGACGILFLSVLVFRPAFESAPAAKAEVGIQLPAYDYRAWDDFPVQVEGRTKPFQTAAREAVKQITGREKFQGQDPVAILLQWTLLADGGSGGQFVDWEHTPFILCDHQPLRQEIFAHVAGGQSESGPVDLHGKFVSPDDLRRSPGFAKLLASAEARRKLDPEKAEQHLAPTERKAEEVARRLSQFDRLSGRGGEARGQGEASQDPLHFLALDKVLSGGWFSLGELKEFERNSSESVDKWRSFIFHDRACRMPQLYLSAEHVAALEEFQKQLKAGRVDPAIDELAGVLRERREARVREFEGLAGGRGDAARMMEIFEEVIKTPEDRARVMKLVHEGKQTDRQGRGASIAGELRAILEERDAKLVGELRQRARAAVRAGYRSDDPEYRMLHLDYLENRFPDLYIALATSKEYPRAQLVRILGDHRRLVEAYESGDAEKFGAASADFFATVRGVSEEFVPSYPGTDTAGTRWAGLVTGRPVGTPSRPLIRLELVYNRVEPFLWAWVVMLGGVAAFIVSLAVGSRLAYLAGFAAYLGALGLEGFGFFARIAIAGRPPVSNMYETLIWVAFMSSVFALVLEFLYPRKVIALAGAVVSTLALVLAAQLPVDLGDRIAPIQPVLRSTYWLTVHVLTIVSSYAAGTLAWGLGNLSLILLAFGKPRRDLVKMLSQFTYRALQIAVLLLAAGTFLGGFWAAESWGRFWGWDPKEVWALIALVCYVIPLHARYIGWVRDFGLAVSAVVCYAAIVMSWYGVNFVLAAGLHSYGFGSGGPWMAFWAGLLNLEWVLIASMVYLRKTEQGATPEREGVEVGRGEMVPS